MKGARPTKDNLVTQQIVSPSVAKQNAPRVIALLNQKGGVGKTTSTANIGAAFAVMGLRTLVVDLDPQSNLSLHFGHEPQPDQPTVRDLFMNPDIAAADLVRAARPNLWFIPSDTELALVEGELALVANMQQILAERLAPVMPSFDVILLDCPPSLGVLTVNALTIADEVVVPTQAQYLALRGLEKLLETVLLVQRALNPKLKVAGVVLCMHESQSSHGKAVVEEMDGYFAKYRGSELPWQDAEVFRPAVRRNIKLAEAPSFGQTIFDYAPNCAGAADYRTLAETIRSRWKPQQLQENLAVAVGLASS
ncbi:MAG: ParA family protein [Phycisphaerales bacterium]|nr:ParA family protein [Phycisphaerales bacterium]